MLMQRDDIDVHVLGVQGASETGRHDLSVMWAAPALILQRAGRLRRWSVLYLRPSLTLSFTLRAPFMRRSSSNRVDADAKNEMWASSQPLLL